MPPEQFLYHTVADKEQIEEGESYHAKQQDPTKVTKRILYVGSIISLSVIAFLLGMKLQNSLPNRQTPRTVFGDCGTTPEQARQRGCEFDVLVSTWFPEQCYDHELMQSYLQNRDWTWYLDHDLEIPISMDQARKGEHNVTFSNAVEHREHCAYVMQKQWRAFQARKPVDSYSLGRKHTEHCIRTLRAPPPETFVGMQVVRFGKCVSFD